MISFTFHQNGVSITNLNAVVTMIYFNGDSGKPFYRLKIDTLWDTKHPGIYVGCDMDNNHYFIHNHYLTGRPALVTMQEFSQGQGLKPYLIEVSNSQIATIENALDEVLRGESYHSTRYNCQTFVNRVCNNTSHSEDLQKWLGRGLVGAVFFLSLRTLIYEKY